MSDPTEAVDIDPKKVQGYCPACGSSSLFLGSGGYVTCSWIECPNPTALADILGDYETKHLVAISDTDFHIKHPLIERLDDALLTCPLAEYMGSLMGPPAKAGIYRASQGGASSRWFWEPLEGREGL